MDRRRVPEHILLQAWDPVDPAAGLADRSVVHLCAEPRAAAEKEAEEGEIGGGDGVRWVGCGMYFFYLFYVGVVLRVGACSF